MNNDRLVTHDGILLDDEQSVDGGPIQLSWSWPQICKEGDGSWGIELNFNEKGGRKYPFVVISLGSRRTQIGWLFW